MAVATLAAHRQFDIREDTPLAPAPGEVQVRVGAVGICGSDLHYFLDGHIGDVEAVYPMVLGHEPAGVITAIGEGVSGWSVGDRVACEPPIYCYHCEWCMMGRHNLCAHGRFMSSPTDPGFFRSVVNLPSANALPLPERLSLSVASLYEPVSIILHSFRFAEPQVGETAAVFGAGPIGLTTIAALRLAGVRRIVAVEPLEHRRRMALHLGADDVLDPAQGDVVRELKQSTQGRGFDLVIDCATQGDTINQSLMVARPAGRVVVTGVPQARRIELDFHEMRRKELGFFSVRRANHTGQAALRMLGEHAAHFAPMITHQVGLSGIQDAFQMLGACADGAVKVVVDPQA